MGNESDIERTKWDGLEKKGEKSELISKNLAEVKACKVSKQKSEKIVLGADSIIYGYDKSNNYICYRENGNTNIKVNNEITLEIEEGKYHLFDKETKKRLN